MEFLEEWRGECSFTALEDFVFSMRTNSPIDLNRELERVVKPVAEKLGLPRWSGAITWKPASASGSMTFLQLYANSGNP